MPLRSIGLFAVVLALVACGRTHVRPPGEDAPGASGPDVAGGTDASAGGTGGSGGIDDGAGTGGSGGIDDGAGTGGSAGADNMAGPILNPFGCDTPHPFVLSIDPAGTSGQVRGWLETSAGLVFEDQLPRLAYHYFVMFSEDAIGVCWSIGHVEGNGQGYLHFCGGDAFPGTTVEVAVANGVSRFADIDIDALNFGPDVVEARTGSMIVYRNTSTGAVVALHVDQLVVTDAIGGDFCAAVDASWRFLR